MAAMRILTPRPPDASGTDDGIAWDLYLPPAEPTGGVVVLHGAGSRKENHADFARAAVSGGLAALVFDARGHGASAGTMDARAVDDVARMADRLRAEVRDDLPVGLRGSSMGGWLALVGAAPARAGAVVAICPAPAALLRAGVAAGRFDFRVEEDALLALLEVADEREAAASLPCPLLLLHARGDERVPVAGSRELAELAPDVRYVEVPGGDHRSIQHDPELQGEAVRFLARALSREGR